MKTQLKRAGLIFAVMALTSVVQVKADALGDANEVLSKISMIATQVQSELAQAAAKGDTQGVAAASDRAKAVKAASDAAQAAFDALQKALEGGDKAAVASAQGDLDEALKKAMGVTGGSLFGDKGAGAPDSKGAGAGKKRPPAPGGDWKELTKGAGGGRTHGGGAPNVYEVPWQTKGHQSVQDGVVDAFWTSTGGSYSYSDGDATPE